MQLNKVLIAIACLAFPAFANASEGLPDHVIEEILTIEPRDDYSVKMSAEARLKALEDSAYTYGARYGLYWRSRQIADRVARYEKQMEVFSFRSILIQDRGFQILPPVVTISKDAFRVSEDGQKLATAKEIISIRQRERLVRTAPNWSTYLYMDVEKPQPPSAAVFPKDETERTRWEHWIRAGFADGIEQADYMFSDDLEKLVTDFTGMVTWHLLNEEGKATKPQIIVENTAVSGGGKEMRIDESIISITDSSKLNPVWQDWAPIVTEAQND